MNSKLFLPIIFLPLITIECNRTKDTCSELNLSFEKIENGIPKGWYIYPQQNYMVSLDSVNVKSEKYSISIEFTGDTANYQSVLQVLPNNFGGKEITLSGYIKTENVTDGWAGLWMRIDPDIAFDNMYQNGVTGTTSWKKYEIALDMNPGKTQQIVLGGLLVGKGKMWLDDLKITVDGKDIGKILPIEMESFSEKAKNDKEFDNSSNIVIPELTEQKIYDLELLGRIWGFLKYHHPAAAKGDYNWDYELFRILPAYLKANDNNQRDKVLLKWINKYGKIPACKTCQTTTDSAFLKPDLSWIERSDINQKLKYFLQKIYLDRHQGNHYYIQMNQGIGNPVFSNERPYSGITFPDAGFRLLTLYRYWNMINYFFPYRYLTDKDWNIVLKEYIPLFIDAKNRLEYELIATLLIAEVCDSHAFLFEFNEVESLKGAAQVPVLVQFIEDKFVVSDCYDYHPYSTLSDAEKAEKIGLKKGDIITCIEGKSVKSIVDSIKKYYPASNETAKMRDITRDILRTDKHTVLIDFISSGRLKQKEINVTSRDGWMYYQYRRKDTDQCYKFINKDIGYITLKTIKQEDIPVIKKEFINTKGIIIDIRNYPFTNIDTLVSYFVSKDTPYLKWTKGNPDNPGEFIFKGENIIRKLGDTYYGKLVVMVNEDTQSMAETYTMSFRAGNNTTIIGSPTAGANGNISKIVLPGGLETRISGLGAYYIDGRETQRIGIVPDIVVKPTIKGIREGRDELLEKAIEIIESDR